MRNLGAESRDSLPPSQRQSHQRRDNPLRAGWFCLRIILFTTAAWLFLPLLSPVEELFRWSWWQGERAYRHELIRWKLCGNANGHRLECSSITVPMDQFNETNSGNKTFTIPLIRLRGHCRFVHDLLINPGGPGGSGAGFLHRHGEHLNAIIGEEYNLVSFDPRGVNSSRPQAVCRPGGDSEAGQKTQLLWSLTQQRQPQVGTWFDSFVAACAENMGEHGKYINAPQAAADMNSILDALGHSQHLLFWGMGYGTILGQTYAHMYSDGVQRMILDGVADKTEWYNSFLHESRYDGSDAIIYSFLNDCFQAGEDCPLTRGIEKALSVGILELHILDIIDGDFVN